MVKFRVVILDDSDNIQEVIYESKVYEKDNIFDWCNDYYHLLHELNKKYDLDDYDNAPYLETQILEEDVWHFHSNTIEDWFNI